MAHQTIRYALEDGVASIALNRPDKLNAFVPEMHDELREALAGAPAAGARAVFLTGEGRGFCAGQDLGQRKGGETPDLSETLDKFYNPLIRTIRDLKVPVVCAVNGVAAGAGMSLALACDIVYAARSATFLQAFVKIGLAPDSGSTWFLPRLAGTARAKGLAMLGEKITAEQAFEWGLIWKVVEDERVKDEALGLARHLATQPTKALGAIKQAIDGAWARDLDAALDHERDMQGALGRTGDYREGVEAFFGKRKPAFRGT
ncbi:MAG: 2-(1,2-epoxy-1,2-dihydrophenyl)acetyl-CoA isomerase [Rhodospirillales bacterium]|nr:2-(1,2-epoxy-1,2-dihydrophenyl)acetyl-CoA isomerase [Rhodospirillales bacterium]